jgi:hypothetical protein
VPANLPTALAIARKSLLAVAADEERRPRAVIESKLTSAEDKQRAARELSTLFQHTVLKLATLEEDEEDIEDGLAVA